MNARIANILVFGVAIVVAIAGCGGSDDEPALTKAEFIKQAEAICKKADEDQYKALERAEKEVQGKVQGGQGVANPAQLAEAQLEAGLAPIHRQVEELRELGAPEGDEEQIEAIVDGMEESLKKGEEEGPNAFNENRNPFAKVDKLSAEYGLGFSCSEAL